MKTYAEKLKDPRWQKKRLEILERDEFKCQYCRSKDKTLHVHHKLYLKGKQPWDYDDDVFSTLCEDCHEKAEDIKNKVLMCLGQRDYIDKKIANTSCSLAGLFSDLTYLQWALESLNGCIVFNAKLIDDIDGDNREEYYESMKESAYECIENLHRALFHVQQTYGVS